MSWGLSARTLSEDEWSEGYTVFLGGEAYGALSVRSRGAAAQRLGVVLRIMHIRSLFGV